MTAKTVAHPGSELCSESALSRWERVARGPRRRAPRFSQGEKLSAKQTDEGFAFQSVSA